MADRIQPMGWQYHVEQMTITDKWSPKKQAAEVITFKEKLNAFGEKGWELVSYQSMPITGSIRTDTINGYLYLSIFKRPNGKTLTWPDP